MECNKDEAIRAKEIAEKKMESNDFEGAKKIALKAKSLYLELENIEQLLSICDVHCSAKTTLLGSKKDWYGILQVEKLADEAMIKKQYRRLALILHPDKNRFPGAESAFKLICEANAVLSDPAKKSLYDSKVRGSNHRINKQGAQSDGHKVNSSWNQTPATHSTFWTGCPYCFVKYQYVGQQSVNKPMNCHNCSKVFMAHEISHQFTSKETKSGQSARKKPGLSRPVVIQDKKGSSAGRKTVRPEPEDGGKWKTEATDTDNAQNNRGTTNKKSVPVYSGDNATGLKSESGRVHFLWKSSRKKQRVL